MSIKDRVLEWFRQNPDERIDNAGMCAALDVDDSQQVSVAFNALHNEEGVKREKVEGVRGFSYWLPKAAAAELPAPPKAPLTAKEVASRVMNDRGPKQSRVARKSKPAKVKKAKKPKKAKKIRNAAAPKKKRAYTRRAPPQAPSTARPAASLASPEDPNAAVFAINNAGRLGIDLGDNKVALDRSDVARLRDFMATVEPLWQ